MVLAVTSTDDKKREAAWTFISDLDSPEGAIQPLMKVFRQQRTRQLPTVRSLGGTFVEWPVDRELCNFLGELGTPASVDALLDIFSQYRNGTEEGSIRSREFACANLLKACPNFEELRNRLGEDMFCSVLANAMMNASEEKEIDSIAQKIKLEDDKRRIVDFLMSMFREMEEGRDIEHLAWKVARPVGTLGTEAGIEVLLQMYRVLPSQKAGVVAASLVKCGIEILRSRIHARLYEEVIVSAHSYSMLSDTDVIKELGRIGSEACIDRLMHVLFQSHWTDEMRRPARQELARLGKTIHSKLLEKLRKTFVGELGRKSQTNLRREIFKVLALSGDASCVQPIIEIGQSDATVHDEAIMALQAIAARDPSVTIPEQLQEVRKRVRTIRQTGDRYVDSCFHCDFEETDEVRDPWEMEMKELLRALDLGVGLGAKAGFDYLQTVRSKYSDFDIVYFWVGHWYAKQGRFDEARKEVREGLKRSKRKYILCGALGDIELDAGNLSEAVRWCIKSIASQVSIERIDEYSPFMYLAYIAGRLGMKWESETLFHWARKVRDVVLDAQGQNELFCIVDAQGNESMSHAIELLCRQFLSKR